MNADAVIQNLARGYANQYDEPKLGERGRELFLANLIHAVDTWDDGPDRAACEMALRLISQKGADDV